MTSNSDASKDWFRLAHNNLKRVIRNFNQKDYADTIFRIQLSTEQLQRDLLLFLGIQFRKTHEPSKILDAIVYNPENNLEEERNQEIFEITKFFSSGIQAHWWTPKEMKEHVDSKFYLILDALDEGKIIYDPYNFLKELRKQLKKDLKEKGVIKTELYWQWPIKKFGDKIEF